jgi:hypothetical protein
MTKIPNNRLTRQIQAVAAELSKLAIACDIKMFEPGTGERILRNDDSVCGRKNPEAFQKIRMHLMALFPLKKQAVDELGATETKRVMEDLREAINALRNPSGTSSKDS